MRVLFLSVRAGRAYAREAETLTADYLRRLMRPFVAQETTLRTERLLLDSVKTLHSAGAAALVYADGGGQRMSSEAFASHVQAAREGGKRTLVIAIGPADGWSANARREWAGWGAVALSLGPMTLPHELARLVLAEQTYRATTILAGHPYHLGHE